MTDRATAGQEEAMNVDGAQEVAQHRSCTAPTTRSQAMLGV